jgi:heat-inducible transcriptional repressor
MKENPKPSKSERERAVLLGLVELYIKTGTPVGSQTLQEYGFQHLSSATLRNYFAKMEEEGYLIQHHASGGRIPTEYAYKLFAHHVKNRGILSKEELDLLKISLDKEMSEVKIYLEQSLEALSELTSCAAFMLAPRFDQDYIKDVRLLSLDHERLLAVLLTDFGFVHTETLSCSKKFSSFSLKRIEDYFKARIQNTQIDHLEEDELQFALQVYNEVVLRHIITYNNFHHEDVYKSGFSRLLVHREFKDLSLLSSSLSLFEKSSFVRSLLSECFRSNDLKFWIGSDLEPYIKQPKGTALIAIPYYLHNSAVGAIAILAPDRLDYEKIFAALTTFSKMLSATLTKTLYKFKISYRHPHPNQTQMIKEGGQILIENQFKS